MAKNIGFITILETEFGSRNASKIKNLFNLIPRHSYTLGTITNLMGDFRDPIVIKG